MSAILFNEAVFGPVRSRRLGISLGINLLPTDRKYCNFDCLYCECGCNTAPSDIKITLPARHEISAALERRIVGMQAANLLPNSITFSGNGEPTLHPDFAEIINDTAALRQKYAPSSQISVLTNATMLHRSDVRSALAKTDMPILKLDSAIDTTIQRLNRPAGEITAAKLVQQMSNIRCIIQTMFLKGTHNGQPVDNTTPAELDAWEQAIITIRPQMVMLYSLDRDTPVSTIKRIPAETLHAIAARIAQHHIPVQAV